MSRSDEKDDLGDLLARLDDETRQRWERLLIEIDDEVTERGPAVVRERLEAALANLLAAGWALHRCYTVDDEGVKRVMKPLGDAAVTVEELRQMLDEMAKKPEWSQ